MYCVLIYTKQYFRDKKKMCEFIANLFYEIKK